MERSRLYRISDICPIRGNNTLSPSGTNWQAQAAPTIAPMIWRPDGYTATVVNNAVLTWYRTFTADNEPPTNLPTSRSLVTLHEWIPTSMPTSHIGWTRVSASDLAAVAFLSSNYRSTWSEHARRHLRAFQKSELTLERGTVEDVERIYPHSSVPTHLQRVFLRHVKRRLEHQADTIDILVARQPDGIACAAFVAGNCEEIKQSTYLIGCFLPEAGRYQPMTGLVDWWFSRSLERGYATVNFGDIVPPIYLPLLERGVGYSVFKTHFGIHRVWLPGSFWKIA